MTTTDEHPVKSGGELATRRRGALATGDPAAAFGILPWLGTSIDVDAAARRFDAWGLSTVIDENTGTSVVAASVFRALHERAGIDARFPIGNAGLLHVYGYLLSTTRRPTASSVIAGSTARSPGPTGSRPTPSCRGRACRRARPCWRGVAAAPPCCRTPRAPPAAGRHRGAHRDRARRGIRRSRLASALVYALVSGGTRRLIATAPVSSPAVLDEVDAAAPRLRWNAVA
jgi:hypothetical protein